MLSNLYNKRFPGIQILYMSSDAAEAVKLFTNAFFAVKVSFFNEIRTISDRLDIPWQSVLCGMLSDGRISAHHTQVPGPDGMWGFGGACLEKDLSEVATDLEDLGLPSHIVSAAIVRNVIDRSFTTSKGST